MMKRHTAIQPLSRQHHTALLAVLLLKKGLARGANAALMSRFVQQVWQAEIAPHFAAEEQVLLPLMQPDLPGMVCDILVQHAQLCQLYQQLAVAPTADLLAAFATTLETHIRREEREYFPAAEAVLNAAALQQLAAGLPAEEKADCLQFQPKFWE